MTRLLTETIRDMTAVNIKTANNANVETTGRGTFRESRNAFFAMKSGHWFGLVFGLLISVQWVAGCDRGPSTAESGSDGNAEVTQAGSADSGTTRAVEQNAGLGETTTVGGASDQSVTNASADSVTPPEVSPSTKTDNPRTTSPASFTARALAWNVESEGADGGVIASELQAFSGYDLFAFTEVLAEDTDRFEAACGDNFDSVVSRSGNNDRMQIVYNTKRFELVGSTELDDINFKYRYRSPMVVMLKEIESEKPFIVMVNHLARGKEEVRQTQAQELVNWAREQSLPVLALGDYNFDYIFSEERGNEAFSIFTRDGIFKWIKPVELIDTNWYDPEPDGIDNYPGSMLDFAFVAQSAMEWECECRVIVREGDFPDDEMTSDHRPFEVTFTTN